jgi:hypothetical protein
MTQTDPSLGATSDAAQSSVGKELASLESAARELLHTAGVYDIGSYGWLNENDVDPDLVGHAMWQLDQPLARPLDDPFEERRVLERPSPRDKQVLVAGEDFCGMMRLARSSIGLALLWRRYRPGDPLNDQPYLDLHQTDAILKLAIASDRLRDVLIVACTGDTVDTYQHATKANRRYVTPFERVAQILAARGVPVVEITDSIAALPPLAHKIFTNIDTRNKIVHEIATRTGHLTRQQADALEQRYDRESRTGPVAVKPMREIRDFSEAVSTHAAELDQAVKTLIDWYALLVSASNLVFQIEYWSRIKPKS